MASDEVGGATELELHERSEPHHTPPISAWTSFTAGCVSGMAAVIVGQVSLEESGGCDHG